VFRSLENQHFRWLWLGRLASSATFQMGAVAQGWLVYRLTGSALALGWVGAGWSISALILSLYGGAISDRVEKRTLLLWTRGAMVLNSLALALLATMGMIQVWHLAASSLFSGVIFAFMMPAQQAILAELVDKGTLLNAISLQSLGMGLMGIFAASLAGVVIEAIGVDGVYYGMALLYVLALFTLTKLPKTGFSNTGALSIWSNLREGVRYIRFQPALVAPLALALVRVLLAMPYRTLMPKYAKDVLGFDATGLGVLAAAPGLGSLISSLVLASLGDFRGKGKLLLVAGMAMGVSLIAFVNTGYLPLVLLFLALLGATGTACMVASQTLLQVNCADAFRGRVMSVHMMMWGLTPLGTIPAGALSDRFGVPPVITAQGAMFTAIFAAVFLLKPKIRRME
jgi:MFS family permease